MKNPPDDDRYQRSRQARQVISGSDVRPPQSPVYAQRYAMPEPGLFSSTQRSYLIAVAVLLVLGLALYLIFSFGVASILFFLLALTLCAGWVVF
jgi:hypothetical protein